MAIRTFAGAASLILWVAAAQPTLAQDTLATVADPSLNPESEAVNNGTDPTLLATTADVYGQFTDIGSDLSVWLINPSLTIPFGKKNVSLKATVPFTDTPFGDGLDVGDASLTFTHVVSVTRERGIAYTVEFFMDTASAGRGFGEPVFEVTGFYVMFLDGGSLVAPALVHTFGVGDPTPAGGAQQAADPVFFTPAESSVGVTSADVGDSVSTTTFDLYYVPKLRNPRLFMTFDPAVIHDWRSDNTFGSLTITFGSSIGKIGKGNLAIYTKPQVLIGSQRPANWSISLGFKLIGF